MEEFSYVRENYNKDTIKMTRFAPEYRDFIKNRNIQIKERANNYIDNKIATIERISLPDSRYKTDLRATVSEDIVFKIDSSLKNELEMYKWLKKRI